MIGPNIIEAIRDATRSDVQVYQDGTRGCLAACAAMLTGTTLDDFERFVGPGPAYCMNQLEKYAFTKGWKTFFGIDRDDDIGKVVLYRGVRAIICSTGAKDKSLRHAAYWDGESLFDPSRKAPPNLNINRHYSWLWIQYFVQRLAKKAGRG